MNFVLGIDAGATRTRACIARLDGTLVARGEGAGANVHQLGVDVARRVIASAVDAAWRAAALPVGRARGFRAVVAGVAGAGAAEDQRALAQSLTVEFGVAAPDCVVSHDLRVALMGALSGDPGAVLIAGTGAACYGRAGDGREWKAGGWGPVLDDGGSGLWLGVQAMRAIVRSADGRLERTPLVDAVMAKLGVVSPRAVIALARDPAAGGLERAVIAALAPVVLAAAQSGDAVATGIVECGADELASMVDAVMSGLGCDEVGVLRLAGVGGLLENSAYYRDVVAHAIARKRQGLALGPAEQPPVVGAVLLALLAVGVPLSASLLARLRAACVISSTNP